LSVVKVPELLAGDVIARPAAPGAAGWICGAGRSRRIAWMASLVVPRRQAIAAAEAPSVRASL
jgi:hypothetical protein